MEAASEPSRDGEANREYSSVACVDGPDCKVGSGDSDEPNPAISRDAPPRDVPGWACVASEGRLLLLVEQCRHYGMFGGHRISNLCSSDESGRRTVLREGIASRGSC